MSRGGVSRKRRNEYQFNVSRRAGADDFGGEVVKIAVAQICKSVGLRTFKESALVTLADIAIRYLHDLGKISNLYGNLAGRTQCNVFDIIRGLEDLEASQGYQGASKLKQCLASSGTMKATEGYMISADETPFARPLPHFPVIRSRKDIQSFVQMGEIPPGTHIPNWLPAFPDPKTHIHPPMCNERTTYLTNKNGSNTFHGMKLREMADEISSCGLPTECVDNSVSRNLVSMVEAFTPVKGTEVANDGDVKRKNLHDCRPIVKFNLKTSKKFPSESSFSSHQKKGVGRMVLWFREDQERSDNETEIYS